MQASFLPNCKPRTQPLIATLSDINMPWIDRLNLLGAIKRRHPELPVMW